MKDKIEYLLVDGYNIIFAWPELRELLQISLEISRLRLIEILANYKGFTGLKIILVFDAHKVNGGLETVTDINNIKVVYTKEKETADTYIEKTTEALSKKYLVRIATSDSLEQIIILTKGAYRVSAMELLKDIEDTTNKMRQEYIENNKVKNNLLIDNMDKNTITFLENLRKSNGR